MNGSEQSTYPGCSIGACSLRRAPGSLYALAAAEQEPGPHRVSGVIEDGWLAGKVGARCARSSCCSAWSAAVITGEQHRVFRSYAAELGIRLPWRASPLA